MKISPKVARIIDYRHDPSNNTYSKPICPFCKTPMLISIGTEITCHKYGGCLNKFSAFSAIYPKPEDAIVIDCIKFVIEMKSELKAKPIVKIEEDGSARPIIKGMGIKKAFRICNDYTKNESSILSYKGKPFEMKFDSLIELDFNNPESIVKKIETYLLFS